MRVTSSGNRVHHDQIVGKHRQRIDRLDQVELFEHPERIGPELNAGADFLKFRGLFDDLRRDALLRQCQRRRKAADAATDNKNLLVFPTAHQAFPIFC